MSKPTKEEIIERFGTPDYVSGSGNMYYFKHMIQVSKFRLNGSNSIYKVRFIRVKDNKIQILRDDGDWVTFDAQVRLKAALDKYIIENIILGEEAND